MKTRMSSLVPVIAVLVAVPAAALASAPRTTADLRKAYLGETTASAKYAVYARQADRDRAPAAAALFRAASQAEKVHASNHKAVLAELGVRSPVPGSFTKAPGTTAQNLKDAIKGETYEKNVMYPAMLKDAAAEKQAAATRSMTYALAAEKQHAALYTAALKSLASKPPAAPYYVCPVCGATFPKTAPARCPVCATPKSMFKTVR